MLKKISNQEISNKSLLLVDLVLRWKNETFKVLRLDSYLDASIDDEVGALLGENQKRFYLGATYFGIYLTQQEARCLYHFLQGKNIAQTSTAMRISVKTISFYFCCIRWKIPCRSRKELLNLIVKTDFMKYMEELEKLETTLKHEFELAHKKG